MDSKVNEIVKHLANKQNRNIAIATHDGPDGDAIGCLAALEQALKKLNKNIDILLQNRISQNYSKIIGEHRVNKIFIPPHGKMYDLIILVDCSTINRTINDIRKMTKFLIVIDHHYGFKPFGNLYYYEKAASTGIILYNIIKKLVPIDESIATSLYLTIRSDTGCFKNNNTDVRAHEIAAELLFKGANISIINEIYENRTLSFIKLLGHSLSNVYYDSQYKITYLVVRQEQIKISQSNYEEASMLIDYIRNISDTDIAFLFIESNDIVKVKARSRNKNVAEILTHFNGGGHQNASGATIYDDIYNAVESVLNYTKACINKS